MENGAYEVWNSSSASNSSEFQHVALDPDETWLEYYGAVRDPLYVVIPISVLYASIFVTGTIGNVSTCIVIARNKSMHTATNYYLFSLAVSDLLLLISGMPAEIYQVWSKYPYIFGETFCVLRGLAAETSSNASVLTITAFTAERYVAICHPFLSHTMSKLSRAVKLILFIWLVALLCAVPQALQFGLMQITTRPGDVMCSITKIIVQHSFELSTIIFFVVPMSVIMVLYVLIGLKLKKSTALKRSARPQPQYYNHTNHHHHSHHHHHHRRPDGTRVSLGSSRIDRHCRHSRSTRRVLKMLVAVVVAFFICWAPFHMQRLIAIYGKRDYRSMESNDWMEQLYLIFTYVSGVLYYFSTTVNPILYNIMSNKFREAFMETLARSCRMSRLVIPRERRSYSSLSRSQQRNPGNNPSRTTGISVATGMAQQESTDCSGNSYRDDEPSRPAVVDLLPADHPILIYDAKQEQQAKEAAAEFATSKSPSLMSVASMQRAFTNGAQSPIVASKEIPLGSPENRVAQTTAAKTTVQPKTDPKKKWWRLLDWLPGLKSLRTATGPGFGSSCEASDTMDSSLQVKQPKDDCFVQLDTFRAKDESCRPV